MTPPEVEYLPLAAVRADPALFAALDAMPPEKDTMRVMFADPDTADRHVWIARVEGRIAGWALRFPQLRETGLMAYHHFFVDPAFRRRGVGMALARAAAKFDHGGAPWRTAGWTQEALAFFLKVRASGEVGYMEVVNVAPPAVGPAA